MVRAAIRGVLAAAAAWLASSLVAAQSPPPEKTCNGIPASGFLLADTKSLNQISGCKFATASVSVVWQDGPSPLSPFLDLSSLAAVHGDLSFTDRRTGDDLDPVTIRADSLDSVNGTLNFTGLPRLQGIEFGNLGSVAALLFQDVVFTEIDEMGNETFPALRQTQSLSFVNTSLASIGEGWRAQPLSLPSADNAYGASVAFAALDNANLRALQLPSFEDGLVVDVHVEDNGPDLAVAAPGLTTATLNLQDLGSFTADSLQQIGTFGVMGGLMPRSESEGGSLIARNTFAELDLPGLTTIGGELSIESNSALRSVSLLSLRSVSAQFEVSSVALESVKLGPELSIQDGAGVTVASRNETMCSNLQIKSPQIVCTQLDEPSAANHTGTSQPQDDGGEDEGEDHDGSGGGGLTTSAKIGLGVGLGLGIPLLILLAVGLLIHRKRRQPHEMPESQIYVKDDDGRSAATTPSRAYSKVRAHTLSEDVGTRPVSSLSWGTDATLLMSERDGRGAARGRAVELEEQQRPRFEMEEQQGVRHEMDARSLPDIDLDGVEEPERRSLEDIERARNSTGAPVVGMLSARGHDGPVSPIG